MSFTAWMVDPTDGLYQRTDAPASLMAWREGALAWDVYWMLYWAHACWAVWPQGQIEHGAAVPERPQGAGR